MSLRPIISPVLVRELVVSARRPWTYWARSAAAGTLAGLALALFVGKVPGVFGVTGPRFIFNILTATTFAACLAGGLLLTCDSIVRERREGTLGLLFLTPLSALDVVLGKWSAQCTRGACALVGVLPVLALPLMMGSIGWQAFVATTAALLATFAAASGIGLWASARSRSTASALATGILVTACLCTVPLLLAQAARWIGITDYSGPLQLISPSHALRLAWMADIPRVPGGASCLPAIVAVAGLGPVGLGLAAAAIRTREARLDPPAAGPGSTSANGNRVPTTGSVGEACAERYARLVPRVRALDWLEVLVLIAFGGFALAACAVTARPLAPPLFITAMFLAYARHALLKIRTALAATLPWQEQAATGTLELLLITPLEPRHLLAGSRRAIVRHIRRTRWENIGINLILCALLLDPEIDARDADTAVVFLSLFLGGILTLHSDVGLITASGPYHALVRHHSGGALTRTLLPVLLPPWLSALFMFMCVGLGMRGRWTPVILILLTQVAQILLSAGMAAAAAHRLQRLFLSLAKDSAPGNANSS